MNNIVDISTSDKEKLLSLPNAVYKKGEKDYSYPYLTISFELKDGVHFEDAIREKQRLVGEHALEGVGYSYTLDGGVFAEEENSGSWDISSVVEE